MKKMIQNLAILSMLFIFSGCTTTAPLTAETAKKIEANEGYVTTTLHSNWKGNEGIMFENMRFIADHDGKGKPASIKMRSNEDFQLLKLEEGHYTWREINIGNMYINLSEDSGFDVEAGKITYIGDITSEISVKLFSARSDRADITDREAENKEKLMQEFPNLVDEFPYQKKISIFKRR